MLLIWLHGVTVAQENPAKELYQALLSVGNTKMAGTATDIFQAETFIFAPVVLLYSACVAQLFSSGVKLVIEKFLCVVPPLDSLHYQ